MRRLAPLLLTLVTGLLVGAPAASAGIWTPVNSGTTATINAIDYRGPGDILIATGSGKIIRNGVQQFDAGAISFSDVELNPAGTLGLATANNGKLYRFNGTTWSGPVSLANTTFPHACPGTGSFTRNATVTGNLTAISWANDSIAYVTTTDKNVLLRVTSSAGSAVPTDVSRQADGTCRADTTRDASVYFNDLQAVGSSIFLLSTYDGERVVSNDGFTTNGSYVNSTATFCGPASPNHLAVDIGDFSRSYAVNECAASGEFRFSSNSATTYTRLEYPQEGSVGPSTTFRDVANAGGSAVAVGDGGRIFISTDGVNAYSQFPDAPDTGTDWVTTDKSSGTDAAVAGKNGRLLVSNQASTIPDIVAPTGAISGPTSATVGRPTTFTANVADNAGGSGINPAAFSWTASGVSPTTTNPATLTFPSVGFYLVRVAFKDNAGNASEATLGVSVSVPAAPIPTSPTVVRPPTVPSPTLTKSASLAGGGSISLGVPRACVPVGSTFKATLAFKRSTKKGAKAVKVSRVEFTVDGKKKTTDKKAPFVKRISVKALKAGSKHTLKARATIKVKKGKRPKKSISTSFTVCG